MCWWYSTAAVVVVLAGERLRYPGDTVHTRLYVRQYCYVARTRPRQCKCVLVGALLATSTAYCSTYCWPAVHSLFRWLVVALPRRHLERDVRTSIQCTYEYPNSKYCLYPDFRQGSGKRTLNRWTYRETTTSVESPQEKTTRRLLSGLKLSCDKGWAHL